MISLQYLKSQQVLSRVNFVLLVLLSFSLMACGRSATTTYYVLDSGISTPIALDDNKALKKMKQMRLSQVDIPEYLDRATIVSRETDGVRLHLAEFDSWAEGLETGAKRVIAEVLTPLLLEKNILLQPLDDASLDPLQIIIQIQRFDGPFQGNIVLDARWTVLDRHDRVLVSGAFVDKAPAGLTYTSMVQAQSKLLAKLAESMIDPIHNKVK